MEETLGAKMQGEKEFFDDDDDGVDGGGALTDIKVLTCGAISGETGSPR